MALDRYLQYSDLVSNKITTDISLKKIINHWSFVRPQTANDFELKNKVSLKLPTHLYYRITKTGNPNIHLSH